MFDPWWLCYVVRGIWLAIVWVHLEGKVTAYLITFEWFDEYENDVNLMMWP